MIRRVNLDHDYKQIAKMFVLRGLRPIKKELFPDTGWIMHGQCAVFVYKTNSKVCIIEHLVSHEGCPKDKIKEIIDHAVNWSKNNGFSVIAGITSLDVVVNHARSFGGTVEGDYSFFYKSLK